ncbi:MAG: hypothetical protein HQL53_10845 [Magnetococcales bacterium]|nr:hypothetical protein [Magnetococcales bacterium]
MPWETVREFAKRQQLSLSAVYKQIKAGRLEAQKEAGRLRVREAEEKPALLPFRAGVATPLSEPGRDPKSRFKVGDWIQVESAEGGTARVVRVVSWDGALLRGLCAWEGQLLEISAALLVRSLVTRLSGHLGRIAQNVDITLPDTLARRRALTTLQTAALTATHADGALSVPHPESFTQTILPHQITYRTRFWINLDRPHPERARRYVMDHLLEQLEQAQTSTPPDADTHHMRAYRRWIDLLDQKDVMLFLGRLPLMQKLDRLTRTLLAEALTPRRLSVGEALHGGRGTARRLIVVAEGALEAMPPHQTVPIPASGHGIWVGPGAWLGLVAALRGRPDAREWRAATEVTLLEIPLKGVLMLACRTPQLASLLIARWSEEETFHDLVHPGIDMGWHAWQHAVSERASARYDQLHQHQSTLERHLLEERRKQGERRTCPSETIPGGVERRCGLDRREDASSYFVTHRAFEVGRRFSGKPK